ncbi:MAG: zinc ABC transporter substrate-binding protein [Endozoicomonas sp. (ex Botrylloides leachii)]|nr:zinc ABC transporter substrate-binding protein [Endozoicomonas sp. (ex Botrylloides leachii)]
MNLWANETKPFTVLASIKPLQLIAQAITNGVSNTEVLLPAGASPHSYSLKISDLEKIKRANVVLWIGPDMEAFLTSVLKTSGTKSIAMMDLQGISKGVNHDTDDHHHHHKDYNPHIWLDPSNALVMAKAINAYLQKMDTNKLHRQQYAKNLQIFEKNLAIADEKNKQLLADVRKKPFFVFHDAYSHLQDHYGLNIVDYFTITPQQQPGAKHLEHIRQQLEKAGACSIFIEPDFRPAYISRVIKGLPVTVSVLDPLGTNIPLTANGYIDFINSLVATIHRSLARSVNNPYQLAA